MSAITALVLKDGASTPVDTTFSPRNVQSLNGKTILPTTWVAKGEYVLLDKSVTLSTTINGNKTSVTRGQVKVPKAVANVNGDIIEEALFSFDFRIPPHFTESDKQHVLAFAKNLIANAVVTAAVVNDEVIY